MSNHDREGSRPSNRDAALERAWREASSEQPPSHLDAALLAAARKSVPDRGERPTTPVPVRTQSRNWLTQWQPLATAAAVTGLAFVLVQMLPREPTRAPSLQRKESAPVPASTEPPPPQPLSSSAREATGVGQAPNAAGPVDRRDRIAAPDPTAEAAVGNTAPRAEATERDTTPTTDTGPALGEPGTDRRKAAESEVTGRAATTATAAPSFPARERSLDNAAPLDAPAWAAKIVALHESGDFTAAEHALRAFRASDPDADSYLPESLRDWAGTVE